VLATATSPTTGKTFPSVWIAKHPKARIVCIALGHDGKAHENPAYQKIIQNSLAWAAGK
jgi:type 1 glutamine amidotransferase